MYLLITEDNHIFQSPTIIPEDLTSSSDGVLTIINMDTKEVHMGRSEGEEEWQDIPYWTYPEM